MVPTEIEGGIERRLVALEQLRAADLADIVEQRRLELDHVAVGINYRMADARPHLGRTRPDWIARTHVDLPRGSLAICRQLAIDTITRFQEDTIRPRGHLTGR